MDNHAQDFARKIISVLEDIKRLVHDAVSFQKKESESSNKQDKKSTNYETPSESGGDGTAPELDPPASSNKPPAAPKQKSFPRLRKYKPVIEVVGVGVLVVYTGVTIALWYSSTVANRIANDALHTAHDNFRQDQRPYIALPELPPGVPNTGKVGIHEGRVRVLLPIQNYGRSPAVDTASFAKIAIGMEQIQSINFDLATTQDIGIVPPGLFPPISAFSEPVRSPDDMKQTMVIYGRIDYTDILALPKPRYSLFFCQAANVEVTLVPSYAVQACQGKNYTK